MLHQRCKQSAKNRACKSLLLQLLQKRKFFILQNWIATESLHGLSSQAFQMALEDTRASWSDDSILNNLDILLNHFPSYAESVVTILCTNHS